MKSNQSNLAQGFTTWAGRAEARTWRYTLSQMLNICYSSSSQSLLFSTNLNICFSSWSQNLFSNTNFDVFLCIFFSPAEGRSSEGPRCRRLVVWVIVVISLPANPWLRYILSFFFSLFYIWQWHHKQKMGCFNIAIWSFLCIFLHQICSWNILPSFECCCSLDFLLFFNFPLITQSHFCSLHFSHLSLAHNITHSSHHTLQKV